jgi:hypothetical protein
LPSSPSTLPSNLPTSEAPLMCVKWRCTYNLHKTKHPPGRAPADDAWSQSQVLMHMHDVTHAFFLLLQGKHVVLTHKCCNWGARSLNQTRSITQEWRDLLTEISLYAVMIYTGEWFIELFTLGTAVREARLCERVCKRACVQACAGTCMSIISCSKQTNSRGVFIWINSKESK